jgi:anti-anti-sigma regulatory factor
LSSKWPAGNIRMGSDSQQVEWALGELLKQNHKKIIFDLSAVTLLDSTVTLTWRVRGT